MAERDLVGEEREVAIAQISQFRLWLSGIFPLILLAFFLLFFFIYGPLGVFQAVFPPIEKLTIERITFPQPGEMRVYVVNGGPEAVTISQLTVDEAVWSHTVTPDRIIPRLGRATIIIPYPWVDGEPHKVNLISKTGVTFSKTVDVATQTPQPDARYLTTFALLGVYAGVIPVFLGLLWYPFLRSISQRWLDFFLSLTTGLLLFLGIDALHEALEKASDVPGAFQGVGIVGIGVTVSILGLIAIDQKTRGSTMSKESVYSRLVLAYMIAVGIGLHNLGEGLAIGAAYTLGQIALGTFLVVGFTLHNTTEGLAVIAPIAHDRPWLGHLAFMGVIAGFPTVLGSWIGGFSYSPTLATLFLAIGAGAIFQVVYELVNLMRRHAEGGLGNLTNFVGFMLGLLIMYGTGLLVAG